MAKMEQRRHAISSHIICHAFTVCAACGHLLLPGAARQLPDKALGPVRREPRTRVGKRAPPGSDRGLSRHPVCTGQAWRQPDW
jgi:hypothetical protein